LEAYVRAIDAVESVQGRLRLDELVSSWAGQQAPLYAQAVALMYDQGYVERAFDYAERARARAFLNQLGNRRLPRSVSSQLATELHEVRGRLIALERRTASTGLPLTVPSLPNSDEENTLQGEALRKRYTELLARLAQSNPQYLSLVQVDTVPFAKLHQDVLPLGTSLIEYFVLGDRTLAFVADRQTLHGVVLQVPSALLEERIAYFRSLVKTRNPEAANIGVELYEMLFRPLKPYIRNQNLIIVPHASLHYLPFAALRDGTLKRYLVEDYALTTVPSANALRYMKVSKPRSAPLLAFGDPDRTLPYAEEEARVVATMFGVAALVGKEASESRLRSEAPRAGILHIAAHAHNDPLQPLFSHIALAGTGDQEDTDGRLHVYEVYDLDLSLARLVVLSACDTALGPRSSGDDVVAFTRAFEAAGVPVVVTTLWSVADASTADLVRRFYGQMRKGASVAKALQSAQIEMLTRKDVADWAPFVVSGNGD
jgi:CHAT domain-containing protein